MEEPHQQGVLRIYGPKRDDDLTDGDRADPESSRDWDYAVTVDCGSSGSRIHIFKWLHRHAATSIPPFSPIFTKHAWTSSVRPGIDSFVDAPEKAIPHFRDLLDFAMSSLSEFRYKWHRTPIYVKATAGMRLIKNLPSRDRIMETIRDFLSNPANSPFYFERSMARVISGEEEGVYGWITANYLAGTLLHASSATSLGVLDMGGASVQITFRPPFDVLSNYFPLRMQQEKIRLYTHSFLNFGANMALTRVHDRIISMGNDSISAAAENSAGAMHSATSSWEGASTASSTNTAPPPSHGPHPSFYIGEIDGVRSFRHPCFPLGYSFTYEYTSSRDLRQSYTGFSSKPWQSEDEALGADLSPITTWSAENHAREMVHFSGSGDFGNCSAITWQLLHKKEACFDNTCSFDGIYVRNTTAREGSARTLTRHSNALQCIAHSVCLCVFFASSLPQQPRFGNVTFIATSNFVKFTHEELHLPANATLEDIDLKSRAICRMSWQALQDKYRYTSVEDLSTLCFKSRYVFTMLYKGFGFPYRGTRLVFARELMGLELDWALGSTLYEVQALPWDLDPGAESFRFRIGEDGSTEAGPPSSASSGSFESEEEEAAAEAAQQDRSRAEGWPDGDKWRGAPGDGSMDRVLQQPRDQRRQAREEREAARMRQEQASQAPAPAAPPASHQGASNSKSKSHAAASAPPPSEERAASKQHGDDAAAAGPRRDGREGEHGPSTPPAPVPRAAPVSPPSPPSSSPHAAEPTVTAPSPSVASSTHHGWSPLMYSLFGGLVVGWFVTLLAFWACMSQARATIRKLEDRAERYEPIPQRAV